jgi:hypothetical protein
MGGSFSWRWSWQPSPFPSPSGASGSGRAFDTAVKKFFEKFSIFGLQMPFFRVYINRGEKYAFHAALAPGKNRRLGGVCSCKSTYSHPVYGYFSQNPGSRTIFPKFLLDIRNFFS